MRRALLVLSLLAACSDGSRRLALDPPPADETAADAGPGQAPLPEPGCAPVLRSRDGAPWFGRGSWRDVEVLGEHAVAVASNGLAVYRVSRGPALREVASLELPGDPAHLRLEGELAWVAAGPAGIVSVDLSDPGAPAVQTALDTPGQARDVDATGSLVAVADGPGGLLLVDASARTVVSTLPTPAEAEAVLLHGDVAFVAAGAEGVLVVDITDPEAPRVAARIDSNERALGLALAGDRLYIADGYGGVQAVDVSAPAAPEPLGVANGPSWVVRDLALAGGLVYAATGVLGGLAVLDFADPRAPVTLGVRPTTASSEGVAVADGLAWIADGAGGLRAVATDDLQGEPRGVSWQPGEASALALDGDRAVVADRRGGLAVLALEASGAARETGRLGLTYPPELVALDGDTAYVLSVRGDRAFQMLSTLNIVDLAAPAPRLVSETHFDGFPGAMAYDDGVLLLAQRGGGLQRIDVRDPAAPVVLDVAEPQNSYSAMALAPGAAFTLMDYRGLQVFDRRGGAPVAVAEVPLDDRGWDLGLRDRDHVLFVAGGAGGLLAFDVREPARPPAIGRLVFPQAVIAVAVDGDQVHVRLDDGALREIAAADPTRLEVRGAGAGPAGSFGELVARDGRLFLSSGARLLSVYEGDCAVEGLAVEDAAFEAAPPAELQLVNLRAGSVSVDARVATESGADIPWAAGLGLNHGTPFRAVPTAPTALAVRESGAPADSTRVELEDLGTRALAVLTAEDEAVVQAPAVGAPSESDAISMRYINATGLDDVAMTLRGPAIFEPLGEVDHGGHGPAWTVALETARGAELMLVADGATELFALPDLPTGSEAALIAARTPDGAPFVLLQLADGTSHFLGGRSHRARFRLVDTFTGSRVRPLAELTPELGGETLPPVLRLGAGATLDLTPGTRTLRCLGPDGALLGPPRPIPLEAGAQQLVLAYDGPEGRLETVVVPEPDTAQTGGKVPLRFAHAHPTLGTVDVVALPADGSTDFAPRVILRGIARGGVSDVAEVDAASDRFGLDADHDGRPEFTFNLGYFPDYGRSLLLASEADGRPIMAAPAGGQEVFWRPAEEHVARLRVVTQDTSLGAEITATYPTEPVVLGPWQATSELEVLTSTRTVGLTFPGVARFEQPLDLEAGRLYTVLGLAQGYAVRVLDDTPPPLTRVALRGAVALDAVTEPVDLLYRIDDAAPRPLGRSMVAGQVGERLETAPGAELTVLADLDRDGAPDLTYSVGTPWSGAVSTFYLAPSGDAPPRLMVHAGNGQPTEVRANEVTARLGVVFLPSEPSQLDVRVGDVDTAHVWMRPGEGDREGRPVYHGTWPMTPVPAGAQVIELGLSGNRKLSVPVELAPGRSYTLLAYGALDDLQLQVREEPSTEGPAARVTHLAVGAPPVDVAVLGGRGENRRVLASRLAFETTTGPLEADEGVAQVALDREGDGQDEWRGVSAWGAPGVLDVYVAGGPEALALVVVRDGFSISVRQDR